MCKRGRKASEPQYSGNGKLWKTSCANLEKNEASNYCITFLQLKNTACPILTRFHGNVLNSTWD